MRKRDGRAVVSQFENLTQGDIVLGGALVTAQDVVAAGSGSAVEHGSAPALDPTPRTEKIIPGTGLEIERALNRVARRTKFNLYLTLARLNFFS
jgi:hypothetical protein